MGFESGSAKISFVWRKARIEAKISEFGEHLGLRRKSWIAAKIADYGENLGLTRKSRIKAKIFD